MALSNSFNYTLTAEELIKEALSQLGIFDAAEGPDSTEYTLGLRKLNLVLKELAGQGLTVFGRDTAYLFPLKTTSKSVQTGLTTDHYTTTTSASAASGASSIVVTSTTNLAATNYIAIKLSNGTTHVTLVSSLAGSTVHLSSVLTGAVDSGAYVYFWPVTSSLMAPILEVMNAQRVTTNADTLVSAEGGESTEIEIIGDTEYQRLPNKMQTGASTQLYVRKLPYRTEFYLWPIGDRSFDRISLSIAFPLDDVDALSDSLAVPSYALNAIVYRLAAELSGPFGLPNHEQQKLWMLAAAKIDDVLVLANKGASTIFEFDAR